MREGNDGSNGHTGSYNQGDSNKKDMFAPLFAGSDYSSGRPGRCDSHRIFIWCDGRANRFGSVILLLL
jgi:hypothetical protein